MPSLVRKIHVTAAADGVVLQPSNLKNSSRTTGALIKYKTFEIAPLPKDRADESTVAKSFESHGIVGLLTLSATSYLISISGRQQVAQIRGKAIYVITDVALIPLSSQAEAEGTVQQTRDSLRKVGDGGNITDSDDSEEEDGHEATQDDNLHDDDLTQPTTPEIPNDVNVRPGISGAAHKRGTSIAQDVIGKKGQYGRFAERWFSKNGWGLAEGRIQTLSEDDPSKIKKAEDEASQFKGEEYNPSFGFDGSKGSSLKAEAQSPQDPPLPKGDKTKAEEVAYSLLPKLLRTTKMMFSSRSFFFSYDYDITRSFAYQDLKGSDLPLHKVIESLFFWNHHIISPFIESGHSHFALPLMQGFVGQRVFTVETSPLSVRDAVLEAHEEPEAIIETQKKAAQSSSRPSTTTSETKKRDFLMTLISRRSVERAGLRYLRRGVDDEGHTANSVETEQILSSPSWSPTEKLYSFVQIRGSIPLYFSQSPYSFKPVPVLQHLSDTNQAALKRHFSNISGRYGSIQVALLVNKEGSEAEIGRAYEKHVDTLNENGGINGSKIGFEWFDFHNVCRGMKFENVSLLMDSLGSQLDAYGQTVEVGGKLESKQSGVLRTNCMDCLDRTNVVQSACGRSFLESQLKEEGVDLDLQADKATQWFNTLWADNGDAISKQYSSTAALKGDYTRTRKRDYKGAINDFGLTLSRYFNNIVNDYFSQAAIDYLLGNVTSQVFEEFEANMMSGDPAMSMKKVRQNAIDTSSNIVVADASEELMGGWTLLCPHEQNSLRSFPFEECVLLLTDAALYAVRFDWNMEKVSSFERVDLRHILGLQYGTYITSTLAAAQMDEKRNVGFIVRYKPGKDDIVRVNTRSLKSTYVKADEGKLMSGEDLVDATKAPMSDPDAIVDTAKEDGGKVGEDNTTTPTMTRVLAFKALPAKSSLANVEGAETNIVSERELVKSICEEIERAVTAGEAVDKRATTSETIPESKGEGGGKRMVEEKDIMSLSEAKKSTGLLEQLGYSLKKLVWA
ncbi:MAG: hypothetical protein M1827_003418 [Pycnora praestabilis]|nr:MAG: hypothetical protein M1827_003418 [Pycnora praestabilis]